MARFKHPFPLYKKFLPLFAIIIRMRKKFEKLQVKVFSTGELETNAYLVFNEQTKEAFLVDCPAPIDAYQDFILKNNLDLKFLILTHGHYDHIDGTENFFKKFPVLFYLNKKDLPMLLNPLKNGSLVFGPSVVLIKQQPIFCGDNDKISFGKNKLQIIETPGHTPGSISVKLGNWLFSGDVIFYHSVGRTDFPFSDTEQLRQSIKRKIFTLEPQTIIYPGHGRETSVAEEVKNNLFFR